MENDLKVLMVGPLPEGSGVDLAASSVVIDRIEAIDPADVRGRLSGQNYQLVVTAAVVADGISGQDIVGQVKALCEFVPVIMVARPDQSAVVAAACEDGLDEHLICGDDPAANQRLLGRLMQRCLKRFRPGHSSIGAKLQVAVDQAIYHELDESVLLLDSDRRIIYFNRSAQKLADILVGQSLRVGQSCDVYLPDEHAPELTALIRGAIDEALRGHTETFRRPQRDDSGEAIVRQNRCAPVYNPRGEVLAVCITSRSLQEVADVEQRLEASKARFWKFVEQIPIGVTILDDQGRRVRANRAFQEILGYDECDLVGIAPADNTRSTIAEHTRAELDQLLAGEREVIKHQKRMLHRDGHEVWTDVTAIVFGRDGPAPKQVISVVTNVTRQHELERQLQRTEKMRVVGQLAGGVAHDFNNLLTIINSYTYHVRQEVGAESDLGALLDKVLSAASRGAKLVEQLQTYSYHPEPQPNAAELAGILDEFDQMLRRIVGADVKVVTDVTDNLDPVWVDQGQLEHVVFNLVLNACDAMPHGGTLTIDAQPAQLDQPVEAIPETIPAGRYVLLAIRDTGAGIDPDILPHIFEPFYTTKASDEGTGLGLWSSWGILKQLSGYIDVESTLGEGTQFTVYLPPANGRDSQ